MKMCKFLTYLAVLFLTGCGTLNIGIERKLSSTATAPVLPADAPSLTPPIVQPSPAAGAGSGPAPAETIFIPAAIQVVTTDTPAPQRVQIYLIAFEDNGQSGPLVGCGDSAIPVEVEHPTREVLRVSMEKLLSLKEQYYGQSGLYNALYQSDLHVESITLDNGKAVINLTGTLMLGGVCDNPRVEAQLQATALQFSTVQKVSIFINGKPLKDALSLKG